MTTTQILMLILTANVFVATLITHVLMYNWWLPRDCRSCRYRSWRSHGNYPDGSHCEPGWWCHRSGPSRSSTRQLEKDVTRPCCGHPATLPVSTRSPDWKKPKLWKRSWPRYIAYKLHCRFVFDEELVRRTVDRLNGGNAESDTWSKHRKLKTSGSDNGPFTC